MISKGNTKGLYEIIDFLSFLAKDEVFYEKHYPQFCESVRLLRIMIDAQTDPGDPWRSSGVIC